METLYTLAVALTLSIDYLLREVCSFLSLLLGSTDLKVLYKLVRDEE